MSDPAGNGYLDKQGLFMALRLIAVCQAGKEPLVSNMALSDPPPKLIGIDPQPTGLTKVSGQVADHASDSTPFLPAHRTLTGVSMRRHSRAFSL